MSNQVVMHRDVSCIAKFEADINTIAELFLINVVHYLPIKIVLSANVAYPIVAIEIDDGMVR
jgi:hypothetical protein